MASATSDPSKVSIFTGTSQQRRSGKGPRDVNYYKSEVTRLGDGSVKRETYRTDAQGNNAVKIQEVVSKDGKETSNTILSTASSGEKRGLSDSGSTLARSVKTQTGNANEKMVKNETEAAAGGQTSIGKKNAEVIAGGSGNNAENDNSESNTKPAPPLQTEASVEGTRNSFPNLRYPINIANTKQDIIKFDMHEYVPSKAAPKGSSQFGFSRGELGSPIGTVVLPIPSGISDQNKADWGPSQMTALDVAKADIAREAIFNGIAEGANTGLDYVDRIRANSGAISAAVGNALSAVAAGVDSQELLSRTTGQVLNPNMELLFTRPALRPFSFKFKLSPRDKEEANEVIKIMRFFKQGGAPIRSKSNLFLKSPHIFRIKYVKMGENGELHRGLNAFKTCALQSFGVNYTPTGNYATYSDGVMVSYDITMSFSEITPIFNDDYNIDDSFIGF
jgi:hypothetical protein